MIKFTLKDFIKWSIRLVYYMLPITYVYNVMEPLNPYFDGFNNLTIIWHWYIWVATIFYAITFWFFDSILNGLKEFGNDFNFKDFNVDREKIETAATEIEKPIIIISIYGHFLFTMFVIFLGDWSLTVALVFDVALSHLCVKKVKEVGKFLSDETDT